MAIFTDEQRRVAVGFSKLIYCNPFLPERIEHERDALGD